MTTKHPSEPCFRLRMRGESEMSFQAAKAAWQASMVRCGLLSRAAIAKAMGEQQ
ncbi:hypothetical protein [Achromobacter mucicolens]|uniref:hypothetical protein n=1 Tax=Achromobacter mucicolens TaxID=1389922 RepID=UPI0022F3BB6F|nr:hypothetical protein [Achromobacter mucicolens]WBX91597.1 hypothetical protein PE062_13445 [Achromobacter mucicolens]